MTTITVAAEFAGEVRHAIYRNLPTYITVTTISRDGDTIFTFPCEYDVLEMILAYIPIGIDFILEL